MPTELKTKAKRVPEKKKKKRKIKVENHAPRRLPKRKKKPPLTYRTQQGPPRFPEEIVDISEPMTTETIMTESTTEDIYPSTSSDRGESTATTHEETAEIENEDVFPEFEESLTLKNANLTSGQTTTVRVLTDPIEDDIDSIPYMSSSDEETSDAEKQCCSPDTWSTEDRAYWTKIMFILGLLAAFEIMGLVYLIVRQDQEFIDALYLTVIILTTVGYSQSSEQLDEYDTRGFLTSFTVVGLGIVGGSLCMFLHSFASVNPDDSNVLRFASAEQSSHTVAVDEKYDMKSRILLSIRNTPAMFLIWLFWVLGGANLIGVVEEWRFVDACYFGINTGSTVGFGLLSPETKSGRLITIFWIFPAIFITATLYTIFFIDVLFPFFNDDLEDLTFQKELRRILNRKNLRRILRQLDFDSDGRVTQAEFMAQILINQYHVEDSKIEFIKSYFCEIDHDGSGFLDQNDVRNFVKELKRND